MEHPDHTGMSANPAAPWNKRPKPSHPCPACGGECQFVDPEWWVCEECDSEWADDPETGEPQDDRDEHDPTL